MDLGYLARRYGKVAVAVGVTGLIALQAALSDNTVTPDEWVHIGVACLGVLGVYFAPYEPAKPAV